MKYVNFYSGTALALIASLLGSLGAATGEMAPPLIVGALLFTVLVLGWAGGASDSRHELDRLTRLEAGRQLQMTCNAAARDRLEEANIALHAYLTDCQAAIEVFTAAQAGTMVRITALEGENAELRKRPSSEVMIETAVRLMRENSADEDSDEEYLNGRATGIAHMHTELVQHMMASAPAAMDSHPSPAAGAVVDKLPPAAIGDSLASSASTASTCGCHACLHISGTTATGMVLCSTCGCKRCPHANDHRHACTGSNEPGQPGSAYPAHVKVLEPGEKP